MDPQSVGRASGWSWPEGMSASSSTTEARSTASDSAETQTSPTSEPDPKPPRPRRRHRPRTCRICLEVVQPKYEEEPTGAGAFFRRGGRVRYVSEDPADGRLISPCKCKGSQKYVHEGCLQAWRRSRPLSERNYWKCPTCSFEYKMERLKWGRWISSRITRAVLTLGVFALTVFILGFIGDPIINLWLDPVGTITDTVSDHVGDFDYFDDFGDRPDTWFDHFLKGFLSLGLLGFVKSLFALSPFYWFNIRAGGGGRRRRGTGRDRLESVNLAFIIVGVFTFLGAVWKGINYLSGRVLERASERVVDVQGDGDDDEGEDEAEPQEPQDGASESRKNI